MNNEIVLLLYNRPHHSIKVFESLIANEVDSCTAYLDISDELQVISNQKLILDYIEYINSHKPLQINLKVSKKHLGLKKSVIHAVSNTLAEHESIILLEDDCVVNKGGIKYFRQALEHFKYEKRIRSVCGYLYPITNFLQESNCTPLLLKRFNPWGWATWADRWQDYNSNLKEILNKFQNRLSEIPSELQVLCNSQLYLESKADIWSVNWIIQHYLDSTYSVYPTKTMIRNIGFDGTGQNCRRTKTFAHAENLYHFSNFNWDKTRYIVENEKIVETFMLNHCLQTYPLSE